jgi:hypothetical protein
LGCRGAVRLLCRARPQRTGARPNPAFRRTRVAGKRFAEGICAPHSSCTGDAALDHFVAPFIACDDERGEIAAAKTKPTKANHDDGLQQHLGSSGRYQCKSPPHATNTSNDKANARAIPSPTATECGKPSRMAYTSKRGARTYSIPAARQFDRNQRRATAGDNSAVPKSGLPWNAKSPAGPNGRVHSFSTVVFSAHHL